MTTGQSGPGRRPLHVCFLWHMHQPSYTDPTTGSTTMPWVRLHGSKDYTDMLAVLEQTAAARATVNWVPGLLDQIEAATTAEGGDADRFLELSAKPATALDDHEQAFIKRHFFSCHHPTMVEPYPRFRELRDRVAADEPLGDHDLRDLQVWFNLAWCGRTVRDADAVQQVLLKGGHFTEADKRVVLDAQRAALRQVIPRAAALAASGRVELSCTPHYHPILPLLFDSDLAREADPGSSLPAVRFRWPSDARAQVNRAVRSHERRFGSPPRGMWPAEGSVAQAVLPLFRAADVRWIATDEAVLYKSLGVPPDGMHYTPWSADGVTVFFRDHDLSDRIGFVYASWDPEDAWADFVSQLTSIRDHLGDDGGVVTIALDGENCWEHYASGCVGFLPGLYERIAATPGLRLSTLSEAAGEVPPSPLARLAAGSWIDGTFRTWLGDPIKNRAWELLAAARAAAGGDFEEIAERDPELAELILKAEASDWWWWFGEGHSSTFDDAFDALFRHHLAAIYQRLDVHPPEALGRAVDSAQQRPAPPGPAPGWLTPTAWLRPRVNGRCDSYFEWDGAGVITPRHGAIHRATQRIVGLRYGNDAATLSIRVDTQPRASEALAGLTVRFCGAVGSALQLWPPEEGVMAAVDEVLEARFPLMMLGAHAGSVIWGRIVLELGDSKVVERFPQSGDAQLVLLDRRAASANRWV